MEEDEKQKQSIFMKNSPEIDCETEQCPVISRAIRSSEQGWQRDAVIPNHCTNVVEGINTGLQSGPAGEVTDPCLSQLIIPWVGDPPSHLRGKHCLHLPSFLSQTAGMQCIQSPLLWYPGKVARESLADLTNLMYVVQCLVHTGLSWQPPGWIWIIMANKWSAKHYQL